MVTLISQGTLRLSTVARSVLGEDLPLIGDDVTVEHLLAHRSGINVIADGQLLSTRHLRYYPLRYHPRYEGSAPP
ncbi:MAG TPA: hypothetical protein VIY52_22595 [Streptosporangiaceae bacterium]